MASKTYNLTLMFVANCSAGTFRNSSNMCQPCKQHTYQDKKWETKCVKCPDHKDGLKQGTKVTGVADVKLCMREYIFHILGVYYNN